GPGSAPVHRARAARPRGRTHDPTRRPDQHHRARGAGPRRAVMHVRPAAPADLDALAALAGRLGYPSSAAEVEARLHLLTAHPGLHAVYVAEAEGAVVGWVHVFVGARLESEPFGELGGLVVDERQ